jgi:hypothetical protein
MWLIPIYRMAVMQDKPLIIHRQYWINECTKYYEDMKKHMMEKDHDHELIVTS